MRWVLALLLIGCASAAPSPVAPARDARPFDLDAFLASAGAPSETACRRARHHADADLARARVERRCGDPDAAERHYRAALAADARCDVALELAEQLPPDDTRALLTPFARIATPSLDAIAPEICRGAALRLAALLRGAEDHAPLPFLTALLGADPNDADALTELALHHLARGQLGAASRVCERVPSNHAAGMLACGRVASAEGSLHVAERRLRASVALDPTGPALLALGRLLVATRRHAEAVPLFHRLHEQDRTDYDALVDLGVALVWSGCIEAARTAYRLATERDPVRPAAWYDLGLLYQFVPTTEQYRESLDAFSRFQEIAEGRPELAPLVRSIRDEACLARRREPRQRGARPSCDPGHEIHIFQGSYGHFEMLHRRMTQQQRAPAAPAAPVPTAPGPEDPPRFACVDYMPRPPTSQSPQP